MDIYFRPRAPKTSSVLRSVKRSVRLVDSSLFCITILTIHLPVEMLCLSYLKRFRMCMSVQWVDWMQLTCSSSLQIQHIVDYFASIIGSGGSQTRNSSLHWSLQKTALRSPPSWMENLWICEESLSKRTAESEAALFHECNGQRFFKELFSQPSNRLGVWRRANEKLFAILSRPASAWSIRWVELQRFPMDGAHVAAQHQLLSQRPHSLGPTVTHIRISFL